MLTSGELRSLDERISANADKAITRRQSKLYTYVSREAGRKPAFFSNCVRPEVAQIRYADDDQWPLWIDDIISGVARLDWYSGGKPLSTGHIVKCFALLDTIDASKISHLLGVGERQAQRYFKACVLCHERLIEAFCDDAVRTMRYPAVFIYPREFVPLSDTGEYP